MFFFFFFFFFFRITLKAFIKTEAVDSIIIIFLRKYDENIQDNSHEISSFIVSEKKKIKMSSVFMISAFGGKWHFYSDKTIFY